MKAEEREAQFQRWFRDHLGLMLKVVRTSLAKPEDQEDLLQNILVNLWSSIPNFRGDSKETTWIYRVSIQTAMVWHRSERSRQRNQAMLRNEVSHVAMFESMPEHDEELIERMYSAIRQLPKVDASIALMHLDGLSYHEISEVLGISENYIGVKLTRIRKQLANELGQEE